ncbi:MAG: GtrA family protein [Bacteroidales bacterium]|nr:GtrA family protein [Bacteroidales bacterium]
MNKGIKTFKAFLRYNIVAIIATTTDFTFFVLLTSLLHVWYVAATFTSAVCGGIISFILNRNWAFMSKDGKLGKQAIKYIIVWNASIFLNTAGLILMVEIASVNEIISKIIVAISVGAGFNFLMYRYFIFK